MVKVENTCSSIEDDEINLNFTMDNMMQPNIMKMTDHQSILLTEKIPSNEQHGTYKLLTHLNI